MDKALDEHFERLVQKIQDPNFLQNQGLSNEVGYYIFPYNVKDTLTIRAKLDDLKNSALANEIHLKIFDLYDIMLNSINRLKGIADNDPIEMLKQMEKQGGIELLAEQINNLMRMDEIDNDVVRYVQKRITDQQNVIFITGVGKVYPIVRAHKVLNTMHQVLDQNPVVIFYPGNYDELSLRIFGETNDNNYYRAFPI